MGNNDMSLVVKILLIVAVVFCGLTLITPWINPGGYTWGGSALDQWDIFYINSFSTGVFEVIFLAIAMIVTFFLSIAALIIGILAIKNIGFGKTKTSLIAGIISIISVIFFLVAVNVVIGEYAQLFDYGLGFFFMIFSAVMFFVAYGIAAVSISSTPTPVTPPAAVPQQMYYQPPAPTPPQQGQPPMQPMPQQTPPPVTPPPPQPQPAQRQPDAAQKFCPECGTKIQGNPKFCPECGKKIA